VDLFPPWDLLLLVNRGGDKRRAVGTKKIKKRRKILKTRKKRRKSQKPKKNRKI